MKNKIFYYLAGVLAVFTLLKLFNIFPFGEAGRFNQNREKMSNLTSDKLAKGSSDSEKGLTRSAETDFGNKIGGSEENISGNQEVKKYIDNEIEKASKRLENNLENKLQTDLLSLDTISENLTVEDNLKVKSSSTLEDVFPFSDDSYDLGSSSKGWDNIYVHSIHGSSILTIGDGVTSHSLDNTNDLLVSGNLEVDELAYFDAGIDLGDNKIINLSDPSENQDAATKNYVDEQVASSEGTISSGMISQYFRGDKTWATLNQAAVSGLTISDNPAFTGLSLSGLTQGSLLFSGTSGAISQSNANLFWDNSNSQLGIGTSSPEEKFHLTGGNFLQTISTNPVVKSIVSLSAANSIYVSGKYAYISSDSENKIMIVDVSNPDSPALISTITDYATFGIQGAHSLMVAGKYMYVISKDSRAFSIIDVSNPANPALAGKLTDTVLFNWGYGIAVSGKYAYIAATRGGVSPYLGAFIVVDISDPSNPFIAATLTNQGTGKLYGANAVVVSGDYAYVSNWWTSTLDIINISNPLSPQIVGTVSADALGGGDSLGADDLYISGRYLYVPLYQSSGFAVIDVSNPSSPTVVNDVSTTTGIRATTSATYWPLKGANSIYVSGKYAYVVSESSGVNSRYNLSIMDVSNPATPVFIGSLKNDSILLSYPFTSSHSVFVSGKYAYLTVRGNGIFGLAVVDISGIDAPAATIGDINASSIEVTDSMDVGNGLYVRGNLNVGPGGIMTDGTISASKVITNGSITGTGALTFAAGGTNQNITLTPSGSGSSILNGKVLIGSFSPNSTANIKLDLQYNSPTGTADTASYEGIRSYIANTDGSGAYTYGGNFLTNIKVGDDNSPAHYGVQGTVNWTATAGTSNGYIYGVNGLTFLNSNATIYESRGLSSRIDIVDTKTGTIQRAIGYRHLTRAYDGTIDTNWGILIKATTKDAGGTVTKNYGAQIEDQTVGGTNVNLLLGTEPPIVGTWSIYNNSTSNNYFAGNIGIGDTTPDTTLKIVGSLCVETDANNCAGSTAGTIYAINTTVQGADYAEYFYTKNTDLQPGEAVCIDSEKENAVKRCSNSGDNNIMGIVSNSPSIIGNTKDGYNNNQNYKVVGMMGQISGKVTNENGPIMIGDSLTSSSISGLMRKANAGESTVGVALQNFDNDQGNIQILISRRNKSLTVEKVEEEVAKRITEMNVEDKVNALVTSAKDELLADSDSRFGDYDLKIDDIEVQLTTHDSQLTNLESLLATLQDQIAELQAKTNQELNLAQIEANTTDIAFLKTLLGTDRVNNLGDLDILGTLSAKKIVAEEAESGQIAVKIKDNDAATIGRGKILAVVKDENSDEIDDETGSDGKSVIVETKAASKKAEIFVTARMEKGSEIDSDNLLAVGNVADGESFEVRVKNAVKSDLIFSWWIVKVSGGN